MEVQQDVPGQPHHQDAAAQPNLATPKTKSNSAKTSSKTGGASGKNTGSSKSKGGNKSGSKKKSKKKPAPKPTLQQQVKKHLLQGPGLIALCAAAGGVLAWQLVSFLRRRNAGGNNTGANAPKAPCANVKPSAKCVALADGSACVVRRTIPADNSCLFNAIAYCMHGSKQKAEFLRGVVAREVSSDPETYSAAFLGMANAAYCHWIVQPHNWGGGIELAILARHYGREIWAWNIESGKQHVFGEEAGYTKAVMVIYTGTHYDALAIVKNPCAPENDDKTEFNPRTKTGKMAVMAALKLTSLSHKGPKGSATRKQGKLPTLPAKSSSAANGQQVNKSVVSSQLQCQECSETCAGQAEAAKHAAATGHTRFAQVSSGSK